MFITITKAANGWMVGYVTQSGALNYSRVYTNSHEMIKDIQEHIAKYGQ